jgi:hypothetical protein
MEAQKGCVSFISSSAAAAYTAYIAYIALVSPRTRDKEASASQ